MILMGGWVSRIVDVKELFLHWKFEKGEKVYIKVPEGREGFCPPNAVLLLPRTMYGLKTSGYGVLEGTTRDYEGDGFKNNHC